MTEYNYILYLIVVLERTFLKIVGTEPYLALVFISTLYLGSHKTSSRELTYRTVSEHKFEVQI
jgi:hypothetical protein